jgi:hypothetical protein
MIKLALPVDGIRAGLLGGSPVGRDYMPGIKARARMLAKVTRVQGSSPWPRKIAEAQPTASPLPPTESE